MINIQVHEVEEYEVEELESGVTVVRITTLNGVQEITLFPARPPEARKPKRKRRKQDETLQ